MFELFFGFVIICIVINIVGCCAGFASYSDILYYPQMNRLDQRGIEKCLKGITPFEMSGYDTA